MVKFYLSLLALVLATSSAMASSSLRRTGNVPIDLEHEIILSERDFDEYYPLNARDTFQVDDLEERSIFGLIGDIGKIGKVAKVAKDGIKGGRLIGKARKGYNIAKQFQQPRPNGPTTTNNRLTQGLRAMAAADNIYKYLPSSQAHPHRRGLEDDEELLQRDFENSDEEFFEREFDDYLAERDAFEDF